MIMSHRRLVARKWDYTARRRPGRPRTAAAIKKLIVRLATTSDLLKLLGTTPAPETEIAQSGRLRCR